MDSLKPLEEFGWGPFLVSSSLSSSAVTYLVAFSQCKSTLSKSSSLLT